MAYSSQDLARGKLFYEFSLEYGAVFSARESALIAAYLASDLHLHTELQWHIDQLSNFTLREPFHMLFHNGCLHLFRPPPNLPGIDNLLRLCKTTT